MERGRNLLVLVGGALLLLAVWATASGPVSIWHGSDVSSRTASVPRSPDCTPKTKCAGQGFGHRAPAFVDTLLTVIAYVSGAAIVIA
ncbi:MAG: hypothetical protein ACRDPG_03850, partial [Nocardioidaceae bacterium]